MFAIVLARSPDGTAEQQPPLMPPLVPCAVLCCAVQLADAADVMARIPRPADVHMMVLTPNMKVSSAAAPMHPLVASPWSYSTLIHAD